MFPVTIDEGAGKEAVVAAGDPIGQGLPRIVVRREVHGRRAEARGFYRQFGLFVRGGRQAAFVVDDFLARLRAGLATHLGEESREAVIILLTPLFVRVMMALRALEPQPKEQLRGVFQLRIGIIYLAVPRHGRVLTDVARVSKNL